MNELETRQLRYFVAVAEERHFGRAAKRLSMAQPPLSRAIRQLEHQLGVPLLERTTRQVALTPAGEVLLQGARTALETISAAGRRARHAGEPSPRLRIALKPDVDGGLLPRILDAYAVDQDARPVDLVLSRIAEQPQTLRDGRADAGLLLAPFDDRGLDYEPLLTEPFLIAMAAVDPLATRPALRLADLAGRILPDGSPADQGPGVARHGALAAQGHTGEHGRAGDGPRTATAATKRSTSDLPQILRLVELGSIVCFLPASVVRRYPRPEIAYRPVTDAELATLAVAWPQDSRSAATAAFVRAATAVSATPPSDGADGDRPVAEESA